jgi:predicted glycoside hydrolase/deacetylase ChbG (UPF0249 family)
VTKRLIVNADGYGFTRGINRGIEAAVEHGVVTSISVNSNYDAIEDLPAFAERFPHVSVGVHLNPVVGPPISDPAAVPTLLGADGEFLGGREFTTRLLLGRIDREELARELRLQIDRVRGMGIPVSHLDSHQNRHLYPRYFGTFLALMRETGIRCMRTHAHFALAESPHPAADRRRYYLRHPNRFATHAAARAEMALARRRGALMADRLMSTSQTGDKAVQSHWSQLLRNVPEGWTEVYCHPAFPDDELRRYATYVDERRAEVDVMTSDETRAEIERAGIRLATFHDLARERG